jgi:hypothetical protein
LQQGTLCAAATKVHRCGGLLAWLESAYHSRLVRGANYSGHVNVNVLLTHDQRFDTGELGLKLRQRRLVLLLAE